MIDRDQLKKAVVALLDSLAAEHPLGHQDSKAARYVLTTSGGAQIELMFEKNAQVPANLWCLEKAVARLVGGPSATASPASVLHAKKNAKGQPLYGRHSSLENMPQLGNADLICFRLKSLSDAGVVLDHLLTVTPAELK